MARITRATINTDVTAINAGLERRGAERRIKLVPQYGKLSIYLTDLGGGWIKHLFMGTTREVYHYLWGMFDVLFNEMI